MTHICFYTFKIVFTFTHLADAFIQSDLQCIQAIYLYIGTCSLGIEPTTFALLYHRATGTLEHLYLYSASLFSTIGI